jgi:hypothetical protein
MGPESKENDERSTRWDMWSAPIGLSNEMGYQARWMFLADDARELL